jgi:hypothetical protein
MDIKSLLNIETRKGAGLIVIVAKNVIMGNNDLTVYDTDGSYVAHGTVDTCAMPAVIDALTHADFDYA